MQTSIFKSAVCSLLMAVPASLMAQKVEEKVKKEVRVVTVTTSSDKDEKVVVEVNGDKITVNGKPIDEMKDGDVKVKVHKVKDMDALALSPGKGGNWTINGDGFGGSRVLMNENKAMLGVSTEKNEKGAKVNDVTKESAAEKMGLKEDDIITKFDDAKIESPDDLSEAIKKHKPGDKVSVTYIRDGKENKATGELTKWKGVTLFGTTAPGQNFNFNFDELGMGENFPRALTVPRVPGQSWAWSGGSPKLGISVQDTDDGKGVKVIEVDDESNAAKAGIKEDDIVTHVDDKAVNSVDEIAKLLREKKESASVRLQVDRGGKRQNIEVKMPRKIKTADL